MKIEKHNSLVHVSIIFLYLSGLQVVRNWRLKQHFGKTLHFSEKSSDFFCGSRPQEWEIVGGKNMAYVF